MPRPPSDRQHVGVRFTASELDAVDSVALKLQASRSDVIRQATLAGLPALGGDSLPDLPISSEDLALIESRADRLGLSVSQVACRMLRFGLEEAQRREVGPPDPSTAPSASKSMPSDLRKRRPTAS